MKEHITPIFRVIFAILSILRLKVYQGLLITAMFHQCSTSNVLKDSKVIYWQITAKF